MLACSTVKGRGPNGAAGTTPLTLLPRGASCYSRQPFNRYITACSNGQTMFPSTFVRKMVKRRCDRAHTSVHLRPLTPSLPRRFESPYPSLDAPSVQPFSATPWSYAVVLTVLECSRRPLSRPGLGSARLGVRQNRTGRNVPELPNIRDGQSRPIVGRAVDSPAAARLAAVAARPGATAASARKRLSDLTWLSSTGSTGVRSPRVACGLQQCCSMP